MVYPTLSHKSYELERTISRSNLTTYKHWNAEKSVSIPIHPGILCFWSGCFVGLHIKEGKRQRGSGALMNILYLISHLWSDVEKLTVPGSSNLNSSFSGTQKKFCVKSMKEEYVTFCFIKLNAKVSPKLSVERWLFCAEVRSLLSKLIFTHIVSC